MSTSEPTKSESHEVVDATIVDNKTPKNWWQTKIAMCSFIVAAGLAVIAVVGSVAYFAGRRSSRDTDADTASTRQADADVETWTCSMDPQVKLPKPGKCPICGMKLTLLDKLQGSGHPRELVMTRAAVGLAEIQTTTVKRQFVTNTIRMVGKVDFDETKLAYITAWVPGRLDRLFIDSTGISVKKGDHLVEIYSPDLVIAQRELIQSWNNYQRFSKDRTDDLLLRTLKSTEEKLRLFGMTKEQIDQIKQRGKPSDHMTIYAPIGGVVIHKNANQGMYVKTGEKIYTIADLTQVWVRMDAYESDLRWVRYGQEVEFTTETYPGEIFKGRIAQIFPTLDEATRTVRVRVNVPNKDGRLKPGMF
ncbi:MAG: efflux RND transporter periplasmic adaptor subunit, partial [Planctomycetes bacterium]|nr:efflux RND transporter periplasmic adaptor subunit [Planctomycetota bacterium]